MEQIARSGTLAKQVEDEIRNRIIGGQIELGSRISEQGLADALGVSKAPVRNALLRLQDEDLVEIRPQKRTVVCKPGVEQFKSASLVRTVLEPVALACAYRQSFAPFIADLKRVHADMVRSIDAGDFREYIFLDMKFHDLFFDHCMNPYLKKSYRLIRSLLAILRGRLARNGKHLRQSLAEHNALVARLERHDCESALEILDRHIAFNNKSHWSDIAAIVEAMYAGT